MMSTGSASCGFASSERVENVTSPQPITPACRASDAASDLSISKLPILKALGPLLHLCHQPHALEARSREASHHLHDGLPVGLAVASHENALIHAGARFRDRLQLRHKLVWLQLGVLAEENLAVA